MNLAKASQKRDYNIKHFSVAAGKYDLATRLLSFGGDKKWKTELIQALPELNAPACLDLACGTGDICFLLADKYPGARITGVDITPAMLEVAEKRNTKENVSFQKSDMNNLPFEASRFDLITGSYAIRNAPDLRLALTEIVRVLKARGTAAFLDFSKPDSRLSQMLQYGALKFWGSACGTLLHANPAIHGYISKSLVNFPHRKGLHRELNRCGLEIVKTKRFMLGWLEVIICKKNG